MKAHNVKHGTKVIVTDYEIKTPPSSIPVNKGDEITIHSLDGMYCNGIDKDGNRIYIAGWTEVEPSSDVMYAIHNVSKYATCSSCNQPKPTVNRYIFDGMCADCTDKSLYDY